MTLALVRMTSCRCTFIYQSCACVPIIDITALRGFDSLVETCESSVNPVDVLVNVESDLFVALWLLTLVIT